MQEELTIESAENRGKHMAGYKITWKKGEFSSRSGLEPNYFM